MEANKDIQKVCCNAEVIVTFLDFIKDLQALSKKYSIEFVQNACTDFVYDVLFQDDDIHEAFKSFMKEMEEINNGEAC